MCCNSHRYPTGIVALVEAEFEARLQADEARLRLERALAADARKEALLSQARTVAATYEFAITGSTSTASVPLSAETRELMTAKG